MKLEIVKSATLTVNPGQVVDVDEKQAALAIKLGLAVEHKETKKRGAAK